MDPSRTPVPRATRAISLSQHETPISKPTATLKNRRALTSVERPKTRKEIVTYGSQEKKPSQPATDVFEFRDIGDGEVEIVSHNKRKRKRGIENFDGTERDDGPSSATKQRSFENDMLPPSGKSRSDEHTQRSEANTIPTVPNSTPPVYSSSMKTPDQYISMENAEVVYPRSSDGRMPTPTLSSQSRTNGAKSTKEQQSAAESLQLTANQDDAFPGEPEGLGVPISNASSSFSSRHTAVSKATSQEAETEWVHETSKDESEAEPLSFHAAGSAIPMVHMPDPRIDDQSYDETLLPMPDEEMEISRALSKPQIKGLQESDQVDELGSDDIAIGLHAEQYQPRPSRSRGGRDNGDSMVVAERSKLPGIVAKAKRKNKRSKTTAFLELIPKEEEEDEEEEPKKPSRELPDLKIPAFAEKRDDPNAENLLDTVDVTTPAPKKQRGRPKKGTEARLAEDTADEPNDVFPPLNDARQPPKRGRPAKKSLPIADDGSDNEKGASSATSVEHASKYKESGTILDEISGNSTVDQPSEETVGACSPPAKAMLPPATPQKSPVAPVKGPDKHSPISSGHWTYRVGLSKKARIEPLLRILRK